MRLGFPQAVNNFELKRACGGIPSLDFPKNELEIQRDLVVG